MQEPISARVIELACKIQQIPAPTFAEKRRSAFVQECFSAAGLSHVSQDSIGNVYACLPGKSSTSPVVITAHLDTVFPDSTDLTLRYYPDKIIGPGIGDNSLGVAAIIGMAWCLRDLQRDLWLVANVCEEGLGNLGGIKAVVERFGRDVTAYLIVEGLSLGHVYNQALNVQRYQIQVKTRGGHAWVDYGQPSAINELAKLIVQLNQLPLPTQPRTTLNIGKVQGGTSINTIAAEARLELDLRSESEAALSRICQQVEELVKTSTKDAPQPIDAGFEVIGQRPGGSLPADHSLVRLAVHCLREEGLVARLTSGSTDANYPLSLGLPAVCVGITTGSGAHSKEEYINTQPVELGLRQLNRLIEGACSQLT